MFRPLVHAERRRVQAKRATVWVVSVLIWVPLASAGTSWWDSSYYATFDAWTDESAVQPCAALTQHVVYAQTYAGPTTLAGYRSGSQIWTRGPYQSGAHDFQSITVDVSAPCALGVHRFTTYALASTTTPSPSHRNAYAHVDVTVVGAPTAPWIREDHVGTAWRAHASPLWSWGGATAAYGTVTGFEVERSWGSAFTTTDSSYHPTLGTGEHAVRVRAQNNAGAWGPWSEWQVARVDVTPPDAPVLTGPGRAWITDPSPTFTWTDPGDAGSGVRGFQGQLDGARPLNLGPGLSHSPTLADGSHAFRVRAVDVAGNRGAWSATVTARVDTVAPVTTHGFGAPTFTRAGETFVAPVTPVTLSATDASSGVAVTESRLDGGGWVPRAEPFPLAAPDGPHRLEYRSRDVAGNVAAAVAVPVIVDGTPPRVTLTSPTTGHAYVEGTGVPLPQGNASGTLVAGRVDLAATAVDDGAGVRHVTFLVDGVRLARVTDAPFEVAWDAGDAALGEHEITVVAVDHVGNAALATRTVTVVPTTLAGANATVAALAGALPPVDGTDAPEPDDRPVA